MNPETFSIREALTVGWQKTKANIKSLFLILLTIWVVSIVVDSFSDESDGRQFMAWVTSILGWILLVLLEMGLIRVLLKILDGGKPAMRDFSSSFMQFLKFVAAGIVYGLGVLVGLILLVIPGIIVGIRLHFYSYLVIEKNLGPIEALKSSWAMTRGQTGKLFLLWLVSLGIVLLGLILLGVGLFVAIPVVMLASAFAYRKLSGGPVPATVLAPTKEAE